MSYEQNFSLTVYNQKNKEEFLPFLWNLNPFASNLDQLFFPFLSILNYVS